MVSVFTIEQMEKALLLNSSIKNCHESVSRTMEFGVSNFRCFNQLSYTGFFLGNPGIKVNIE